MLQLYPQDIDKAILDVITRQPCGRDPQKRPKPADAYQLAVDLERWHPEIADNMLLGTTFGGDGSTAGVSNPPLTQQVQYSCQRLKRAGKIRVRYKSTRNMGVWRYKTSEWIRPSYEVCGEYELKDSRLENDAEGWHE